MDSSANMTSIERVLTKHSRELVTEEQIASAGAARVYRGATIEGGLYDATVIHEFTDAGGTTIFVTGRCYDIDELAGRFPDCEVGY